MDPSSSSDLEKAAALASLYDTPQRHPGLRPGADPNIILAQAVLAPFEEPAFRAAPATTSTTGLGYVNIDLMAPLLPNFSALYGFFGDWDSDTEDAQPLEGATAIKSTSELFDSTSDDTTPATSDNTTPATTPTASDEVFSTATAPEEVPEDIPTSLTAIIGSSVEEPLDSFVAASTPTPTMAQPSPLTTTLTPPTTFDNSTPSPPIDAPAPAPTPAPTPAQPVPRAPRPRMRRPPTRRKPKTTPSSSTFTAALPHRTTAGPSTFTPQRRLPPPPPHQPPAHPTAQAYQVTPTPMPAATASATPRILPTQSCGLASVPRHVVQHPQHPNGYSVQYPGMPHYSMQPSPYQPTGSMAPPSSTVPLQRNYSPMPPPGSSQYTGLVPTQSNYPHGQPLPYNQYTTTPAQHNYPPMPQGMGPAAGTLTAPAMGQPQQMQMQQMVHMQMPQMQMPQMQMPQMQMQQMPQMQMPQMHHMHHMQHIQQMQQTRQMQQMQHTQHIQHVPQQTQQAYQMQQAPQTYQMQQVQQMHQTQMHQTPQTQQTPGFQYSIPQQGATGQPPFPQQGQYGQTGNTGRMGPGQNNFFIGRVTLPEPPSLGDLIGEAKERGLCPATPLPLDETEERYQKHVDWMKEKHGKMMGAFEESKKALQKMQHGNLGLVRNSGRRRLAVLRSRIWERRASIHYHRRRLCLLKHLDEQMAMNNLAPDGLRLRTLVERVANYAVKHAFVYKTGTDKDLAFRVSAELDFIALAGGREALWQERQFAASAKKFMETDKLNKYPNIDLELAKLNRLLGPKATTIVTDHRIFQDNSLALPQPLALVPSSVDAAVPAPVPAAAPSAPQLQRQASPEDDIFDNVSVASSQSSVNEDPAHQAYLDAMATPRELRTLEQRQAIAEYLFKISENSASGAEQAMKAIEAEGISLFELR